MLYFVHVCADTRACVLDNVDPLRAVPARAEHRDLSMNRLVSLSNATFAGLHRLERLCVMRLCKCGWNRMCVMMTKIRRRRARRDLSSNCLFKSGYPDWFVEFCDSVPLAGGCSVTPQGGPNCPPS